MKTYKGDMRDYIYETQDVILNIINKHEEITKNFVDTIKDNIDTIYIIGAGTSNFSGISARVFFEKIMKVKTFALIPTEIIDNEYIINENTLVIGISASGTSSNTIEAIEKAKADGGKTLVFTNDLSSPIAKRNQNCVLLDYGIEDVAPKSKSYVSEMVTLSLCALDYAKVKGNISHEEHQEYLLRLKKTAENLNYVTKSADEWYDRHSHEFAECERMLVVGYESNKGNIKEGALKILECGRFQVSSYELEEFMHGIYHSIDSECFLLYISNSGKYFDRSVRLKEYLSEFTNHQFLVYNSNENYKDDKSLSLNFVEDPDFYFLEYIIPMQIVSYRIAKDKGINPNIPSDPLFHKKMDSKFV